MKCDGCQTIVRKPLRIKELPDKYYCRACWEEINGVMNEVGR